MKDRKPKVAGVIATVHGWVDPSRGELLVAMRDLPDAIAWDRRTNTFGEGNTISDIIPAHEAVLESVLKPSAGALAIQAPTGHPPREWTDQEKKDAAEAMKKIVEREKAAEVEAQLRDVVEVPKVEEVTEPKDEQPKSPKVKIKGSGKRTKKK